MEMSLIIDESRGEEDLWKLEHDYAKEIPARRGRPMMKENREISLSSKGVYAETTVDSTTNGSEKFQTVLALLQAAAGRRPIETNGINVYCSNFQPKNEEINHFVDPYQNSVAQWKSTGGGGAQRNRSKSIKKEAGLTTNYPFMGRTRIGSMDDRFDDYPTLAKRVRSLEYHLKKTVRNQGIRLMELESKVAQLMAKK